MSDYTQGEGILGAVVPVIVLLALGILAATGSRAFRVNPIVGYLALGMALSAAKLDQLITANSIAVLAELGTVFLLFDIGLHFSIRHVRAHALDIFGFGTVQVLLGTAGLAALTSLSGMDPGTALLVGATLSLSSTAVVAGLIAERHQQNCPVGLTGTAILVFQDVAAIFILIVATALGTNQSLVGAAGLALAKAVAAVGIATLLARVVVRPLFHLIASTRNEEVFTAVALLVALTTAWATGEAGLSLTLGAFLGGMVIAETPYRPVIQSEIRPFRGLLLSFFFISVGRSLDRAVLLHDLPAVLGVAVVILVAKIVLNGAASLIFRWSVPGSTQLGFLLAQGSEFAFVIFGLESVRQLVGLRDTSVLIAAVALTLAMTPSLAGLGRCLAGRMRRQLDSAADPEMLEQDLPGPVFITGMGRRGRAVADALREFGIGYAALEHDERRLREAVADGYDVVFGDIGDPKIWDALALGGRKVNVLTAPKLEIASQLTPLARTFFPNLRRIAAVSDANEGADFAAAGLVPIVDAGPIPGMALAAAVLAELGIDKGLIEAWAARHLASAPSSSAAVAAAAV